MVFMTITKSFDDKNQPNPIHWDRHEAMSISQSHLDLVFSQHSKDHSSSQQKSFAAWQQEADRGDAEAQYQVGIRFEEGWGVKKSYKKALKYFRLAADQGHQDAQISLALCLETEFGTQPSDEQAFYYYQLASNQGNPIAQAMVGKYYEEGKIVERDLTKAISYYQQAADQEVRIAWDYLAEAYEKGIGVEKSLEKAYFYRQKRFHLYKGEADAGDAEAQAMVGWFFENGEGVEKSLKSATYYYNLAAEQNHPSGFFYLAQCFEQGFGVPQSIERAIHYYELAAAQGQLLSMLNLADLLIDNHTDEELAVHYLKLIVGRAVESKSRTFAQAQYKLADCFEKGIGINQSNQNALYYYQLAAEIGYDFANYRLGNAYLEGELGLKQDGFKAVHHYRLAANQGSSSALEALAKCYEKGIGVEKSLTKAFEYYQNAAKIEIEEKYTDDASMLSSARRYLLGKGIPQSILKAIAIGFQIGEEGRSLISSTYLEISDEESLQKLFDCFKQVVKQGEPWGYYFLADMYASGHGVARSDEKAFKYFKLAADAGIPEAQDIVSKYEENRTLLEAQQQAFRNLLLSVEQGDADVQYGLGYCFGFGRGTDQDLERAVFYYRQAANQGNCQALCALGNCYEYGKGIKQSYEEAFKLYKKAADQGYVCGQFDVGFCYKWGRGVEKSLEKAIEYFNYLLEGDFEDKKYLEGVIYDCKKELDESLAEAKRKFYQLKAQQVSAILPAQNIVYAEAKKLDTSLYVHDRRIEVLRGTFEKSKDEPIFLFGSSVSYEEMIVIRDAMLENPRFTFICHSPDYYSLYEAFHRLGYYESSLKKRWVSSKDGNVWYGFLFVK